MASGSAVEDLQESGIKNGSYHIRDMVEFGLCEATDTHESPEQSPCAELSGPHLVDE